MQWHRSTSLNQRFLILIWLNQNLVIQQYSSCMCYITTGVCVPFIHTYHSKYVICCLYHRHPLHLTKYLKPLVFSGGKENHHSEWVQNKKVLKSLHHKENYKYLIHITEQNSQKCAQLNRVQCHCCIINSIILWCLSVPTNHPWPQSESLKTRNVLGMNPFNTLFNILMKGQHQVTVTVYIKN